VAEHPHCWVLEYLAHSCGRTLGKRNVSFLNRLRRWVRLSRLRPSLPHRTDSIGGSGINACALRSDDTEARGEARRCFGRSDRHAQALDVGKGGRGRMARG
jgi:hypothetical protein